MTRTRPVVDAVPGSFQCCSEVRARYAAQRRSVRFPVLPQGFARSGLPVEEMFRDYLMRGGRMCSVELEACLLGLLVTDPREHDIAALVLNEYFLGQPHCYLVAYATLTSPKTR